MLPAPTSTVEPPTLTATIRPPLRQRDGGGRRRARRTSRRFLDLPFAGQTRVLLSGVYEPAPRERVVVVISGGNSTAVDFGDR